jgi:feruloyl esterase
VWAADPELQEDFAYRADHKMLLAAHALIEAFYGAPPAYNYFAGCSDGGREAMEEAQRFPGDFQGILAGSAGIRVVEGMENFLWKTNKGRLPDGKSIFDQASISLLHAAVIQACDELDGVKDGQIDDIRHCHFSPAVLECKAGQQENCLSAAQVQAARDFYNGPTDAAGHHLYLGGEPYGDELNWDISAPRGHELAPGLINWMIYSGHPPVDMDVDHWQFNDEEFRNLVTQGAIYEAHNPDLRPFRDAGGKLIMWQGTADAPAGNYLTVDYYQAVRDVVGGLNEARRFARVFLIPGVYHCTGGYVPYDEDLLGALVNWVEAAKAPEKILSTAYLPDGTLRTRPVFAYPAVAAYKGSGDINQAESFFEKMPAQDPDDHYDWLGAQYK